MLKKKKGLLYRILNRPRPPRPVLRLGRVLHWTRIALAINLCRVVPRTLLSTRTGRGGLGRFRIRYSKPSSFFLDFFSFSFFLFFYLSFFYYFIFFPFLFFSFLFFFFFYLDFLSFFLSFFLIFFFFLSFYIEIPL